jgi:hypothetical protein
MSLCFFLSFSLSLSLSLSRARPVSVSLCVGVSITQVVSPSKQLPRAKAPSLLSPNLTLKDYQWEGVAWLGVLRQHGVGGILADEMVRRCPAHMQVLVCLCTCAPVPVPYMRHVYVPVPYSSLYAYACVCVCVCVCVCACACLSADVSSSLCVPHRA